MQEAFSHTLMGRPGSVGDSYTYRHSVMCQKVASGEWLAHSPRSIEGVSVKPFVVADSAFPLEPTCIKCYEIGQPPYRCSFNYSLIRTRKVVEQAFGRLKGRWKIMDGQCMLNDPVFARHVAMVWVDCTMFVKGITVHLSLTGFQKKVTMLKPHQLICK